MSKATAIAAANIAFIKYWGAQDLDRALPLNQSISMTLSECVTRTTVEHLPEEGEHLIQLAGEEGDLIQATPAFAARIAHHLSELARDLGVEGAFRVATINTFPSAAGIASSASGFAALATATTAAVGQEWDASRMSIRARLSGSGSAARSVLGGYVEWPREIKDPESAAHQLAGPEHWELCDLVAVVDAGAKGVSSRDGHRRALSSPYFRQRLNGLPRRLETVRRSIAARDLVALGEAAEAEAIDLHLIAMSSDPPIFYWRPGTLAVLERVRGLRHEGCAVYATMDAGPNVHVICEPEEEDRVAAALGEVHEVIRLIRDRVGPGPRLSEEHLF